MRLLTSHLFSVSLAALLTACSVPEVRQEAPAINKVALGSKFVIILPENHKTGHLWQLEQNYDKKIVKQLNEVWHGNEKGIYFYLLAKDSGATVLSFISRKYQDTVERKQFIISVAKK